MGTQQEYTVLISIFKTAGWNSSTNANWQDE